MTLFTLKNLLKINLLLLLMQLCLILEAQKPDTLVVYEYVLKKDTVWIDGYPSSCSQEPKKLSCITNEAIIIDSDRNASAGLLIFPGGWNATFPVNRVLIADNSKRKSMKRFELFGITFLALNSYLLAQPEIEKNIGIYLRGSIFNQVTQFFYSFPGQGASAYDLFSPGIGVKGNYPLGRSLSLSPRIGFSYLNSYASVKDNSSDQPVMLLYGRKFNFLSSDLHLNYYFLKGDKIFGRLYGGLRADCFLGKKGETDLVEQKYNSYNPVTINYLAGIGFDLGKRLFAEVELSDNINRFIDNEFMRMRYSSFSINLGYYLF